MDLDEFLAGAKPRTVEVRVCARGDLAARHAQLRDELAAVAMDPRERDLSGNPRAREISEEIVQIEGEMEAHTRVFTVRAASRNEWANLLAAHPPTKEQQRAGENTNPLTFPVAAVAACCDELDEAKATRLADVLPQGEWLKLWTAVVTLNVVATTVPKLAAATEILQANAASSTTSGPAASPGPRSLAGSGEAPPSSDTTTPAD